MANFGQKSANYTKRLLMNYPINSIKINRFRGIEYLEIERFSRINLLLGKNNVGKTSIVEAVFLLTGMSNPTLPNLINVIRTRGSGSPEDLQWLFYNGDYGNSIMISDTRNRSVQISPILGLEESNESVTSSISGARINGLRAIFEDNEDKYESSFRIEDQKEIKIERSEYKESIVSGFLPSNEIRANVLSNIKALIERGQKEQIVQLIREFDSRVENLEMLDEKISVKLVGIEKLMPISFIGDGLHRFIGICASIINQENKVVLIDEIDNGLHYTVLKQLWKSLIDLSIKNDTQLFITTHNEESLRSLAMVLEEDESSVDLSVFSIQNTEKSGLKAYQYPSEALQSAIEKQIEIR